MGLFKGILNFVKKPVAFVAKTAGAIVGLPALGTAVGNVINSIGGAPKVQKMAVAAAASGAISAVEVANTLEKNGVTPTKEIVAEVSKVVQKVAVDSPEVSVQTKSELPITSGNIASATSTTASTAAKASTTVSFKLWDYIKNYWYLALPSGLIVVYLVYKSFKK